MIELSEEGLIAIIIAIAGAAVSISVAALGHWARIKEMKKQNEIEIQRQFLTEQRDVLIRLTTYFKNEILHNMMTVTLIRRTIELGEFNKESVDSTMKMMTFYRGQEFKTTTLSEIITRFNYYWGSSYEGTSELYVKMQTKFNGFENDFLLFASYLQKDTEDKGPINELMGKLEVEAEELNEIVDDFLTLCRIDLNQQYHEAEKVKESEILKGLETGREQILKKYAISLEDTD